MTDGVFDPASLSQGWAKPSKPRPIVIFGAGSIVGDAHFPAYGKAGFPVAGLFDPDHAKAERLAQKWGVTAYRSVEEAAANRDVVFDLATPPARHAGVLRALPDNAVALIQKPMGSDLTEATEILAICRAKNLKAAVNFQLRFAPMMLALKDAIASGWLGNVVDFDAWLALATPWQLWEFLLKAPRVEIAMHSIHYLDLIRQLLGDPRGVHAKTLGHPGHKVAQTRTSAILDYGDSVRCALSINHDHKFGRKHQACEFRICGTEGAAYLKLGLNLDYPRGEPDILEIYPRGGSDWVAVPLVGAWFPDAFVGRMANVQRYASGEDAELVSSVEDAWNTMALVEAAYQSSAAPATPIAARP
ncbi:Gfo/Idh/MocA family oxidoreductase [Mesorhizobium sp. M9A.F.Ca.ET.002.03.1.2]|uniref:Gfo/Idh/MocA family protein n=1 Tax=Mesorhizobium sp. M9A.F.Ca.ET.002.03.1.2 TaxID=2493668 RepID=UPI000F761CDC|nr:Gfo/Idh/MocA family oxidoreductase [Mesorhizobium sp. M9A.F.Ca.ET.002.03.1.2]AZN98356.1 Gfo/Idh/MocA family oxidoreductase [Mesorhizobium sp. M9A.F.Ca.ET.002.03.1.2]